MPNWILRDATYQRETEMDEAEQILKALSNPNWEWRTVGGLSKETGIPEDRVQQFLDRLEEQVIRSRVPDKKGRALYTTRDHYKQKHSPLARMMDQFRSTST